jgi:predicted esterase
MFVALSMDQKLRRSTDPSLSRYLNSSWVSSRVASQVPVFLTARVTILTVVVPYVHRLENDFNFSLFFVDGPIETTPEASISSFWDQPCYRFFHWSPSPTPFSLDQVDKAIAFINAIIDREGPFDGVMGFSQGAVMALATMLRHADQQDPPFKFAILFSVPYIPDRDDGGRTEEWGRINVPALVVAGEGDEEWFEGSKRTVDRNCQKGLTTMIVHKGGHAVPKDKATVGRVLDAIEDLLETADSF